MTKRVINCTNPGTKEEETYMVWKNGKKFVLAIKKGQEKTNITIDEDPYDIIKVWNDKFGDEDTLRYYGGEFSSKAEKKWPIEEATVFTYADFKKAKEPLRLSDFENRVREGSGNLRSSVLNHQCMYVTHDVDLITHIAGNGIIENKDIRYSLAKQHAPRGMMIIPYIPRNPSDDSVVMQRLKPTYTAEEVADSKRKEAESGKRYRGLPKYLSPLSAPNEPYIPRAYFDKTCRDEIAEEIIKESGVDPEVGREALKQFDFDNMEDFLTDSKIPLAVVEGEYKGLTLFEAMIEDYKNMLQDIAQGNPPRTPIKVAAMALIGVNGMYKNIGSKKNKVYSFIESFEPFTTEGREIIVGLDNDCAENIAVAFSGVSIAQASKRNKGTASLLVPPQRDGKKLGWDDFVVEAGITDGYNEIIKQFREKRPQIEPDLNWKDLENAVRDGKTPLQKIQEKKEFALEIG